MPNASRRFDQGSAMMLYIYDLLGLAGALPSRASVVVTTTRFPICVRKPSALAQDESPYPTKSRFDKLKARMRIPLPDETTKILLKLGWDRIETVKITPMKMSL